MSTVVPYVKKVTIPTLDEFASKYPQYRNRAIGENRVFFDIIMSPEGYLVASIVNDELGLPAAAGVAKRCAEAAVDGLSATDKQFIGAAVCAVMEANSHSKTGRKRAIPHRAFTRGEVYTTATP